MKMKMFNIAISRFTTAVGRRKGEANIRGLLELKINAGTLVYEMMSLST
jgi:hypothetical protein